MAQIAKPVVVVHHESIHVDKDLTEHVRAYQDSCRMMGQFMGADRVEYMQTQRGEQYTFWKNGQVMTLTVQAIGDGWLVPEVKYEAEQDTHGFQECPACAAKPGSPVLCAECLRRREELG